MQTIESKPVKHIPMHKRHLGLSVEEVTDVIAVEEPLEIRVGGEPVSITMRTPGADDRLAVGLLYAEGVLSGLEDLGRAYHCGRPGTPEYGNAMEVLPGPGTTLDIDRMDATRRGTLTTSACGVCGRRSIDDLMLRCEKIESSIVMPEWCLLQMVEILAQSQPVFKATGGLHAAAAFDEDGKLMACFEDVGRHNAVDKVFGDLLYRGHLGHSSSAEAPAVLVVSGRASFEIVQKAAVARVPIVTSVSAVSSLAVSLAESAGVTLVGFARTNRLNVYTSRNRITTDQKSGKE